jgi:hypothetical protein
MVAYLPHDKSELRHIAAKGPLCPCATSTVLNARQGRRCVNNVAIWRPSRPLCDLIVFAVVIVGRRDAAQADIGCSLEVGVLYARGDSDLLGIGIIDDVDPAPG